MNFKELLIEMIKTGDSSAKDVSAYKLTYTVALDIFNELKFGTLLLVEFAACDNLFFTYTTSGSYIKNFTLTLPKDYNKRKTNVYNVVEEIKTATLTMSSFEKVLYVHDYLCYNSSYDTSYNISSGYTYSSLILGKGLCCGYSQAMELFMRAFGIEYKEIHGNNGSHVWIQVKIDGEYYHVDPTWDDPITEVKGRVWHKNFMLNDNEIMCTKHYGWKSPTILTYLKQTITIPKDFAVSNSTRYSGSEIRDVTGRLLYKDKVWTFVNSKKELVSGGIETGAYIKLVDDVVSAVDEFNGYLVFSSGKSVFACNRDGTNKTLILCVNSDIIDGAKTNIDYLHISDEGLLTYTCYNYLPNGSVHSKNARVFDLNSFKFQVSTTNSPKVEEQQVVSYVCSKKETDISMCDIGNISNWKSGLYDWITGSYVQYPSRICLNEYKTFTDGDSFIASISDLNYKLLIRELDSSNKFLRTTTVSNGTKYIPGKGATYLGISLYNYNMSATTQRTYLELFENGFKISLNKM